MDGWNTTFLLGWPIFRGELLVSGRVMVRFKIWVWLPKFLWRKQKSWILWAAKRTWPAFKCPKHVPSCLWGFYGFSTTMFFLGGIRKCREGAGGYRGVFFKLVVLLQVVWWFLSDMDLRMVSQVYENGRMFEAKLCSGDFKMVCQLVILRFWDADIAVAKSPINLK